jgi:hypothetical protein
MDAHRGGYWVRTHDQSRILPGIISRPATLISNARPAGVTNNASGSGEYSESEMDVDTERNSAPERGTGMESAIQDYLHNLGKQLSKAREPLQKSVSPPHFANGNDHAGQSPVQPTRPQGSGPLRHGFPTSDSRSIDSQPPPPSWAASKPAPLYSGLYGNDTTQLHLSSTQKQWPDLSNQAAGVAYLPAVADASPAFPHPPIRDQMEFIVTSDDATWNEFMRGLGLGMPGV